VSSLDRQVFENLQAAMEELLISNGGWARAVREDFYLDGDTQTYDHEMPLIQITDEGQRLDHLRGRMETWQEISVEIWSQSANYGGVSSGQMRDWRHEVELKIGEHIRLDIPGGLHMRYLGNSGPVRIRDNIYMTALFLEYQYYKPFTGSC
jgi:hypothetical protein